MPAVHKSSNGASSQFHQSLEGLAENPLRRTWRGTEQGTIELETVPRFDNPYDEREWIKAHMAAALRYWGKLGFGEGAAGHITVRDSVLPDHYWMNPFAVHFSTITKSKLVLVGPDGYVSSHGAQLPINTAGFHIHSAIHKRRPDIKAAGHCHSLDGKAWSAFGRPIDILTQDSCLFYDNLGVYNSFGGIVLAQEEGENIAQALGPKFKTCILQNHGLLTVGNTVDEMVYLFSALDRQCKAQLMVEAAAANGIQKTIINKEDAEFTAKTIQWWENTYVNVSASSFYGFIP
ncbi:arad-like aldolase/epimerase [Fistulina hepatica ATCC 64428]|uniref:Arad-like aldolase/epimerase n=1 Tax=Fistulina hepatica ATCC 64428 TaxID=1128425 RepID=A0A0D7A4N7_9AGAR|nr:arad-like aldolase/epimerase [Fistulina hepatica ATCC 64428]